MNTEQKLQAVHYKYTVKLNQVVEDINHSTKLQTKLINKYGWNHTEADSIGYTLAGLRHAETLLTQFIESIEDVLGYSPSRNYPTEYRK